jgi:hypothetical protein
MFIQTNFEIVPIVLSSFSFLPAKEEKNIKIDENEKQQKIKVKQHFFFASLLGQHHYYSILLIFMHNYVSLVTSKFVVSAVVVAVVIISLRFVFVCSILESMRAL